METRRRIMAVEGVPWIDECSGPWCPGEAWRRSGAPEAPGGFLSWLLLVPGPGAATHDGPRTRVGNGRWGYPVRGRERRLSIPLDRNRIVHTQTVPPVVLGEQPGVCCGSSERRHCCERGLSTGAQVDWIAGNQELKSPGALVAARIGAGELRYPEDK